MSFCLIGDPNNCIFTQYESSSNGSIILYTENWQSGILDISSIPNNEDFIIEFTASRCGLGGHFGYTYIDDLCLLHSDENLQGSIQLNPLFEICPTFPLSVYTYSILTSNFISLFYKFNRWKLPHRLFFFGTPFSKYIST